jgi:lipopolysaccharide cholinephosphotransferase
MKYGTELRKVQLTILDIIKEVVRVCEENDIKYFIIAGTALGAVRHRGFIPWDDDLDIGMTRENYNKFLKIAPKKLPQDLFLQTVETDPKSIFYFAKVRKQGTKFVERYCRNIDMHQGVFIDIFPFDNIPDKIGARKKHYRKVSFWSNLYISKCVSETSVPQYGVSGIFKVVLRKLLHYLLKPLSKCYLLRKLDLACQEYNLMQCKTVSFVVNPCLQVPLLDAEHTEKILFEGLEVRSPGHVEQYLKHNYGDYLTLPPVEKRIGHRPYILEV